MAISDSSRWVSLKRGFKTRLLRVPNHLPWESNTPPLSNTPRFMPALLTAEGAVPAELRVYPGPPLERKISYLDGVLLGSAALFSTFLNPAAAAVLESGIRFSQEFLLLSEEIELPYLPNMGGSDSDNEEGLKPWELYALAKMQDELLEAASIFKTDKRASPESRKRELIRAFRTRRMLIKPPKQEEKKIRELLNRPLQKEACEGERPKGYAKSFGLLVLRPAHDPEVEDYQKRRLLTFTNCWTEHGLPLAYSDLSSRLERLNLLAPEDNLLLLTNRLLYLTGGGDFVYYPFAWWNEGAKGEPDHISFSETLYKGSFALRITALALAGLAAKGVVEVLHAIKAQRDCTPVGQAAKLLENTLALLYRALANLPPDKRAEYLMKATRALQKKMGQTAWKTLTTTVRKFGWDGAWTAAETVVYGVRTPLPRKYWQRIEKSADNKSYQPSKALPLIYEVLASAGVIG